jgi:hypothetical protein
VAQTRLDSRSNDVSRELGVLDGARFRQLSDRAIEWFVKHDI